MLLDMTGKLVIIGSGRVHVISVNVYNNNSATNIF